MHLLDTNHCSRLLEGDVRLVEYLRCLPSHILIVTCAIVHGELIYMAERSRYREQNLLRVQALFRDMEVLPVDEETANRYGRLQAELFQYFGPKDRAKQRRTTLQNLGFSDNDLWIAASALRHGLTVVSNDSDFQRMQAVMTLPLESWLSP